MNRRQVLNGFLWGFLGGTLGSFFLKPFKKKEFSKYFTEVRDYCNENGIGFDYYLFKDKENVKFVYCGALKSSEKQYYYPTRIEKGYSIFDKEKTKYEYIAILENKPHRDFWVPLSTYNDLKPIKDFIQKGKQYTFIEYDGHFNGITHEN